MKIFLYKTHEKIHFEYSVYKMSQYKNSMRVTEQG
jgi:hypothetical protein